MKTADHLPELPAEEEAALIVIDDLPELTAEDKAALAVVDDRHELPPTPDWRDSAESMVRETIDEELTLFEVLVVTDVSSLKLYTKPDGALTRAKARVAVVTDPANPLAADKLMVQWAQAGKPVVSWCSMTDRGRRAAREVAATLNPYLQTADAARVQHIVKDPRDWQPLVDPFDGLVAGARRTVPAAPGRSSGGGVKPPSDDFDVTSLRSAERLLLAHPGQLLVVTDSQDALSDMYVLGENGVWQRGDVTLREWMGEMADELYIKATQVYKMAGKELGVVTQRIRRLAEPATLVPIREQAATALRRLLNRGELAPGDVTTCLDTDLNDNLRYLGAPNGVIDLYTAKLLPPAEGRRHLVTWQTPVAYDPTATHEGVDRLFGHLREVPRVWFWEVLGYHLLGSPSRRFYVVEGPKAGGKSTLANALEAVLGPYASRPQDTALEAPRASGGISPEIEKLTLPRRFALFVELTITKVSSPQVKRFCGDDSQTLRKPYKTEITARLTATMLLFCNPGSVPHLRLQDEAMADRLCVLPYPGIPESSRDPLFTRRVQTDERFKQAFLARLVASAAAQEPGVPPEEPPEVAAATAERVRDDLGELGEFAQRLVRDAAATLPFADVWDAWCQYNEEDPTNAQEPGGITKRRLSRALRNYVPRLPVARQFRVDGDQRVRGFRGWRLLSPEEAEQAAAEQQAETEPATDYTPSPEAAQAIRDLLKGFPDDFSFHGVTLGRGPLYGCLLLVRNDDWLLTLRDEYQDGHRLAEQLAKVRDLIAYYGPEKKPMTSADSIRQVYPKWDDDLLATAWLSHTVSMLAWAADRNRPVGPAYQQAQDRFSSLDMITPKDNIALNTLFEADRHSGGSEADAAALALKAVDLLVDELGQIPLKEADRYNAGDIEAAIKELLGLEGTAPAAGQANRSTMDQGGGK